MSSVEWNLAQLLGNALKTWQRSPNWSADQVIMLYFFGIKLILMLYTVTSLCIYSILFSINFLKVMAGRVWFFNLIWFWFKGYNVRRNWILCTLNSPHACLLLGILRNDYWQTIIKAWPKLMRITSRWIGTLVTNATEIRMGSSWMAHPARVQN